MERRECLKKQSRNFFFPTEKREIVKDKVDRLICFSGIDVLTAVETVVEIHDFTRFATAAEVV